MPHLSELHGAATHLAVVAIPLYVIVLPCRRAGIGRATLDAAEPWVAGGVLALVAVIAQGYLGGRMTYDQGVGIDAGGQFARTATGARQLEVAIARGTDPAAAGRKAFARSGLGCASCHGDQAQGRRGPSLAGGVELEEFRGVHGSGLFPPDVVSDRDFAAINAWLKTLKVGPA